MGERGAYLAACGRLGITPQPPAKVPGAGWVSRLLHRLVGVR